MSRPNQGRNFTTAEDAYIKNNFGKPADGKMTYVQIAQKLSEISNNRVSVYSVRRRHDKLNAGIGVDEIPDDQVNPEKPTWSSQDTDTHQVVTFVIDEEATVRNVASLLERAHIDYDKEVWFIKAFNSGAWTTPMRTATTNKGNGRWENEIGIVQNYKVQIRFERLPPLNPIFVKRDLIESMKAFKPKYPSLPVWRASEQRRFMLEPTIFDWHFGKLAWGAETGEKYDINIAEKAMDQAVDDIILRTSAYQFEQILFPIGQDLLHIDTAENATTKGTRQDVDTRIQKIAKVAREIMVRQIDKFRQIAPVVVKVIPGNHDRLMTWTLGDSLECWYHDTKYIVVDNSPTPRKYHRYGNNLIGYTHGSDEKIASLGMIMATEQRGVWSETKFHQWHIGHTHHAKETAFVITDSQMSVNVRVIRSLSGTDAWHAQMGYVGDHKAAEAFVWHRDLGPWGEFIAMASEELYK